MEEFILVGVVMILAFGAYWAMVLFPRQRDFQKRQKMAVDLSQGDEIITYGGIIGKVLEIDSEMGVAIIEIAEGIQIRIIIDAMMQRYEPEAVAENAQMGQKNTINH